MNEAKRYFRKFIIIGILYAFAIGGIFFIYYLGPLEGPIYGRGAIIAIFLRWTYGPYILLGLGTLITQLFTKRFRVAYNDDVEQVRLNTFGWYAWLIPFFGPIIFAIRFKIALSKTNIRRDEFIKKNIPQERKDVEELTTMQANINNDFWKTIDEDGNSIEEKEEIKNINSTNKKLESKSKNGSKKSTDKN